MPEEPAARIGWFIRLRWLAAAGALAHPAIGHFVLGLSFRVWPFVLAGAGIALYNLLFLLAGRKGGFTGRKAGRFATMQVAADIIALTLLMHLGGGIENPFISYYLFHTIIAAVLLPWWKVVLQVVCASMCMACLAIAELTGLLAHHHIVGLFPFELYDDWKFVAVTLTVLTATLCVTAVLGASIAERLRERERKLGQANAALVDQDRIKSQYVMRVAHDLAAPAGMITSCLKLVTQNRTGPIPEAALDMVRRAESKSEYLGQLIRDLLSLSRIKAAQDIPKTSVSLAEVVSQVFEDLQPHAGKKRVVLQRKLPASLPLVHGNMEAIHELLGNLIGNAVKYTRVGGRVCVSASSSGNVVVVEVEDDGVGIPADALPHIFEEFYRADNVRAEAVEGTGLGLSIVSQILSAHGGRIWVESEEEKGSTFSFSLPIVESGDAQTEPNPVECPGRHAAGIDHRS